jgi:hypothetical protein
MIVEQLPATMADRKIEEVILPWFCSSWKQWYVQFIKHKIRAFRNVPMKVLSVLGRKVQMER